MTGFSPLYSRQKADFVAAAAAEIQPLVDEAAASVETVSFAWSQVSQIDFDPPLVTAFSTTLTGTYNARTDAEGFTGIGQTYTTPGMISFNAVRIKLIPRRDTSTNDWTSIKVVLRTHATDPSLAAATKVAVGEVKVNPRLFELTDLIVPLKDPTTGEIVTLTESDLLAEFGIAYQAKNASGNATAGEAQATVSGITKNTSYYLTSGDLETSNWNVYAGNPTFGIELLNLTDLTQTDTYTTSAELKGALGLTPSETLLTSPKPDEIQMTPRWFGIEGYEGSIYFHGLTSGLNDKRFDCTGGLGLGEHNTDRWRWPSTLAITSPGTNLTLKCIDPAHLTTRSTKVVATYVCLPNAASGESRTGLVIGDSIIENTTGLVTQRLLDLTAANSSGLHTTLIGTRGSGANKHEGRGGWALTNFFSTYDAGDGKGINPFIQSNGQKFNFAWYLSNTGQATPDWVALDVPGINDIFSESLDSETALNAGIDAALDKLDRVIGLIPDATVGSLKASNASIKTLILMPLPPAKESQTGFGKVYKIAQSYAQHKRKIAVLHYRLIRHYANSESDGVFLIPWHVAADPVVGWTADNDPIHPQTGANSGYNQLGDQLYYALNNLVDLSLL